MNEDATREFRDKNHCYICKMGWMPGERTPVLYDRKNILLCLACKNLMDSRALKDTSGIE